MWHLSHLICRPLIYSVGTLSDFRLEWLRMDNTAPSLSSHDEKRYMYMTKESVIILEHQKEKRKKNSVHKYKLHLQR